MRPAKKIEPEHTVVVIDFKTRKTVNRQIDTIQNDNDEKHCFRSDHRYYCHETECVLWNECQKLVAVWMR